MSSSIAKILLKIIKGYVTQNEMRPSSSSFNRNQTAIISSKRDNNILFSSKHSAMFAISESNLS